MTFWIVSYSTDKAVITVKKTSHNKDRDIYDIGYKTRTCLGSLSVLVRRKEQLQYSVTLYFKGPLVNVS